MEQRFIHYGSGSGGEEEQQSSDGMMESGVPKMQYTSSPVGRMGCRVCLRIVELSGRYERAKADRRRDQRRLAGIVVTVAVTERAVAGIVVAVAVSEGQ